MAELKGDFTWGTAFGAGQKPALRFCASHANNALVEIRWKGGVICRLLPGEACRWTFPESAERLSAKPTFDLADYEITSQAVPLPGHGSGTPRGYGSGVQRVTER